MEFWLNNWTVSKEKPYDLPFFKAKITLSKTRKLLQRIVNTLKTFRPTYADIDVLETRREAEIAKAFII
jgi:hypothetical protein